MMQPPYERLRAAMVDQQVAARGVADPLVLAAMRRVRRERFVPPGLAAEVYADAALSIGAGQTISQPYIVGVMLEAMQLRGGERVLDVGTGSGYAAAVLAEIAGEVWSIERIDELARLARVRLEHEGCTNVHLRCGDGSLGWPEAAPFDAIVVAAGAPSVPKALQRQLAMGGRLVIPVGAADQGQRLVRITRDGENAFRTERLLGVRFVPLRGVGGFPER